MGTLTPIKDRLDAKRADNVVELRKQPRWIERMQQKGLPPQDRTAYLFRPGGDAA
jgi:hypothetical protein